MNYISAEELFNRLTDQYTATELVDVLGLTTENLKDIGMVDFIEEHLSELTSVLESLDVRVSE